MAFPADYTLLVEYDLPTITGTHTDFVMLLKYDDFNVGDALDFWDNGGGDLRISDDINGTTQLPIEVVEFDKVGLSAQVWVKIPSAFTGKTIYLWGDNAGDSQPAVTDAYGRNAVWSAYEIVFHGDTIDDSTGNSTPDIVATSGAVGKIGNAYDFNGSNQRIYFALPVNASNVYTLSAWANVNDTGVTKAVMSIAEGGSTSNQDRIFYDANEDVGSNTFFGSRGAVSPQPVSAGWNLISQTIDQTASPDTRLYSNATLLGSNDSATDAFTAFDRVAIGTTADSSPVWWFDGLIEEFRASFLTFTADYIATEYDNQSTAGAWGTPTRVGGGGATYTINIDNLAATGSFTNLSLLHNKKLNLDTISATTNFDNVDLHYNRKLQLNALAATGQFETVTLRHNRKLNLDTLTASGQFEAVTLDYNQGYSLTLGTLAATGGFDDVSLRHNRKLNLGTLSATGQFNDVTLNYTPSSVTHTLALDTLTATASFDDVSLRHNRKLNVEPIVATAYFDDVALLKGHKLNLNSLSSTATFNDVELLHNKKLGLDTLQATANFGPVALNWSGFIEQRITNFSVAYKAQPFNVSYKQKPITIKFKE